MGDGARMTVIGVVSLIIGAAGGWWYGMVQVDEVTLKLMGALQEKEQVTLSADRLRKANNEAPAKFGKELGKLVSAAGAPAPATPPAAPPAQSAPAAPAAATATDDPAKLIDTVRGILAARDRIRGALDGVRGALNSEFDALATELGNATPDAEKLKQTLDSLKQNWPQKEKGMETATRGLLVDLGVLQAPAAPAPAPAPQPAAAPAPAPAEKK